MAVKVGSARIDENGRAHGGKAGNQTGKELSVQNWYRHFKGWRVLSAKPGSNACSTSPDWGRSPTDSPVHCPAG